MGLSFESDRNIQVTELNETSIMDGLVAYYTMDSLNLIDNSGNNNNGTNYGATITTGISNNALSFNGSSNYVDCGSPTSLNFGLGDFSCSLWVKQNALSSGEQDFITKLSDTGFVVGVWQSGRVFFYIGGSTNADWVGLTANNWFHLVFLRRSGIKYIYSNGIEVANFVGNVSVDNANSLYIGKANGSTYYFNGLIDEVRIYNRALSAAEVKQLYKLHAPNNISSMKEE